MILRGKCVSPGIAEGRIHVVDVGGWLASALSRESATSPELEMKRFEAASHRAAFELGRVRNLLTQRGRAHDADIFAAHATMLGDEKLRRRVEEEIRAN